MRKTAALVVVGLLLTGCYGAMQSAPNKPMAAGDLMPNVEDKDAGLVAMAEGVDLKAYRVVTVARFPVTDPAVKDDDDRKLAEEISSFLQTELVRRLRASGVFDRVVNLTETEFRPAAGDTVLRLDGTITRLGEGSQALRAMWGMYGAGRAQLQAETRFRDGDRVVLATADRRTAQMGFFGGSSRDHLRESVDDMARDLAKFLVRASRGEKPAK